MDRQPSRATRPASHPPKSLYWKPTFRSWETDRSKANVAALAKDIEQLDAGGIEYVVNCLLQAIEGVSLIHRGLNPDGKPVGYTLDTFSATEP